MFDFSILISLLISVFIFHFTLYLTFKKELEDLNSYITSDKEKIKNRRKKIKSLNIVSVILVVVILVLYFLPSLEPIFKNVKSNISIIGIFSNIRGFLQKLVPFKKGFFISPNFKFSYITGIVLSVIFEIICFMELYDIVIPSDFTEFIFPIILILIFAWGLIWINNYISLFLSYCIIHYFEFLSIVLNIVSYAIILIIVLFIMFLYDEYF